MEGDMHAPADSTKQMCSEDKKKREKMYVMVGTASILAVLTMLALLWVTLGARSRGRQELAVTEHPDCPLPDRHERPVICFMYYTFQMVGFSKADLPTHLCRSVVLCCINSTSQEAVNLAVRQGLELKSHMKRAVTYIGVGGPWLDYAEADGWLQSEESMKRPLEIIDAVIWEGGYNGGAALWVPDWLKLTQRSKLDGFSFNLLVKLNRLKGSSLLLFLPQNTSAAVSLFSAETLEMPRLIPVMPSHIMHWNKKGLNFLTCSSPNRAAGFVTGAVNVSLESTYSSLKQAFSEIWPDIGTRMIFTFSLSWMHFVQQDPQNRSAGAPGEYRATIAYGNVCKKRLGVHRRSFRDFLTDCQIISDGGADWYSGVGEEASDFLRFHKDVKGIMIFDVDFDDFNGTCRDFKYPQLHALHDFFLML